MFEHNYYGSAAQIEDLQEEQLEWMTMRNGISAHEDDVQQVDSEDDELTQYVELDEPPTFQRVEDEPDDFRLMLAWWLR